VSRTDRLLAAVPVGEMLNRGRLGRMETGEYRRRSLNHMVSSKSPRLQFGGSVKVKVAEMGDDIAKSTSYVMRKYRKAPPSVILHLHPTHFRFDQQDGTFSYSSPMRFLLEHIKNETVPHDIVEELLLSGVKFYEGTRFGRCLL